MSSLFRQPREEKKDEGGEKMRETEREEVAGGGALAEVVGSGLGGCRVSY